jgi:hypothetical protein
MWNLTTLCGGHHAARHEALIEITGRAPAIKVRWLVPGAASETNGRGNDDATKIEVVDEANAMRDALLEREIERILHQTRRVPRGTSTSESITSRAGGGCGNDDGGVELPSGVPRGT